MKFQILIAFILLINPFREVTGQVTFQKTYGGTNVDYCLAVKQTKDGGFIMGGYSNSFGTGLHKFYLIKTNELGDILWTSIIGDTLSNRLNSLEQTLDDGYIITGQNNGEVLLLKINSSGMVQWYKKYNLPQTIGACSVHQTFDGG